MKYINFFKQFKWTIILFSIAILFGLVNDFYKKMISDNYTKEYLNIICNVYVILLGAIIVFGIISVIDSLICSIINYINRNELKKKYIISNIKAVVILMIIILVGLQSYYVGNKNNNSDLNTIGTLMLSMGTSAIVTLLWDIATNDNPFKKEISNQFKMLYGIYASLQKLKKSEVNFENGKEEIKAVINEYYREVIDNLSIDLTEQIILNIKLKILIDNYEEVIRNIDDVEEHINLFIKKNEFPKEYYKKIEKIKMLYK